MYTHLEKENTYFIQQGNGKIKILSIIKILLLKNLSL